ncbi:MAG: hypothetical protein V2I33_17365 [Kangiellaceae bacterium]|jgi:hypothetical protein|nr:hypothetical protein [Kangiellaceae bacterium]
MTTREPNKMFFNDFQELFQKFPLPSTISHRYRFRTIFTDPSLSGSKENQYLIPTAENPAGVFFFIVVETTSELFSYTLELLRTYISGEKYGEVLLAHREEKRFLISFHVPQRSSFLVYFDKAEELLVKCLTRKYGFLAESWKSSYRGRVHKNVEVKYFMIENKKEFDTFLSP